ncbi:DUF6702 family protein [Pedobacter puniceum]|uniref:Uncharacterized protein n=1 Tax=Pedobacter puniceum TaxID=2666136 RepID=A0A7K0FNF4_9SPHI|nr:DUF6702 family protein [Pedobacter puniceum]MRX46557.1 hypothetical protein [Pedobacter puniceum]
MLKILSLLFVFFHPFYVSVTEIRQNPESKTIQISTKIFFDDLEKAIKEESSQDINILKPTDKAALEKLIAAYLQKHLYMVVNGKTMPANFLGFEIEEDAAWCYLETEKVAKINKLEVFNDVLFKQHDSQVNILNVLAGDTKTSTKLDNPKNRAFFSFK